MTNTITTLKNGFIVLTLLWTLGPLGAFLHAYLLHKADAERVALERAQTSISKDIAYRTWVSSHGGVYVPITKQTPPNPYLAHLKKRDVTTVDGKELTLMNPAYTLRQLMSNFSDIYGFDGKITSLKTLNPVNTPDSWEVKALLKVEETKTPYYEFMDWQGEPMLRYMNPMVTKSSCLKCHGHQGYKLGETRGGVSVSIPISDLQAEFESQENQLIFGFSLIWLLGLIVIAFTYRKIRNVLILSADKAADDSSDSTTDNS